MANTTKKLLSLVLAMIMVLSLIPAVSAAETEEEVNETPAATEPAATEPAVEGGCGGAVSFAGLALGATLGTCTVFVAKKKED